MTIAKLYTIDCQDVGVDCDFEAQGASIEEIIEKCSDHVTVGQNTKCTPFELTSSRR